MKSELVEAFRTAAEAHAFAFVEVDGEDADWAYWYAGVLQQPLSRILGQPLTRAQIVVCLTAIEDERLARFGSEHAWREMYAEHFMTQFGQAKAAKTLKLSLYYYPECPYCQRVLKAIRDTGAQVELRHIWDEPERREELQAARGRTTVPVLRIEDASGDRWMPESADIARYLHDLARH